MGPNLLMTLPVHPLQPHHRTSLHPHARPQVKGVADAGAASLRVSGLELGGLFGSLLAGKLSDMLINNGAGKGGGNVGKRVQVCGGGGGGRCRGGGKLAACDAKR